MTSSENPGKTPPLERAAQVAEHFFRHEAGKLVATLTRSFGVQHLSLAEDVVQEALARALHIWPYYGVPENPSAWLTQVAKNLALDVVRREKSFRDKEPAIVATIESVPTHPATVDALRFEDEIGDDTLRMLFVCCHPELGQDAQVALALKTLCGFSTLEIGRAFLTTEATIAKRLTRAKQRLRDSDVTFELPVGKELAERFHSVLQTLYLLFNEGYKASGGDRLVREDLCHEAIRLVKALVAHPVGNQAATHALLALMLLNTSRLGSRVDPEGNLLRLEEQDRSSWDREMIALGIFHLGRSAMGEELSDYHLQAAIAACHCTAPDYGSTDWPRILGLYDQLAKIDGSPVIALNRAIAVANVHGPAEGLQAIEKIHDREKLESYHLLYAVLGDLESRLEHLPAAAKHFQRALKLAETTSERAFLAKRLGECGGA
jgi:RNA polymerase sigma-70 factor (ECF subfamily)